VPNDPYYATLNGKQTKYLPSIPIYPLILSPAPNSPSKNAHKSYTIPQSAHPPLLFPSPFHPPLHRIQTHLIKTSHRLIRTPNLHLIIRRLPALTPLLRTLHTSPLRIIPLFLPTEHVFSFFVREGFALVVACLQDVLVGAGHAFETVVARIGGGWVVEWTSGWRGLVGGMVGDEEGGVTRWRC
jgi:hypothetical protein